MKKFLQSHIGFSVNLGFFFFFVGRNYIGLISPFNFLLL